MGHLLYAVFSGHLVYDVTTGHLLYDGGVPDNCPWGESAPSFDVTFTGTAHWDAEPAGTLNGQTVELTYQGSCIWEWTGQDAGGMWWMIQIWLVNSTYWEVYLAYSGETEGLGAVDFIHAKKYSGSSPVGAYSVTFRDNTESPDSNTLDDFVVSAS